jgi:hypothetical protein
MDHHSFVSNGSLNGKQFIW